MFSNAKQYSAANKAFLESQLATITGLATIALQGTEKMFALTVAAAKASPLDSAAATRNLLAAKDPQALLAAATAYVKLNTEKAGAYNRELTDIVAASKAEWTRITEAQLAEAQSRISALVDGIAKSAPAGSENAIALLKSSVANAYAGYEQVNTAAKQAVEATQAQVSKASDQFSQAVKNAAVQ
jgi:phasin family protein